MSGAEGAGFGVYVHVPFCRSRCDYCAFATYADRDHLMGPYVAACLAEIGGAVAEGMPEATSVFLGGGTPSLLEDGAIGSLLAAIPTAAGAEVTIESNPEDVTAERVGRWMEIGVTRVSVGIQSTVPRVLEALGRRHERAASLAALDVLGASGLTSWNADLIFGTVGESDADWERSVREVVERDAPPPHVSAYALTAEAGTPLGADRRRHPDPDLQAARYAVTSEVLESAGYAWEEISNWAKPGHGCRHNRLYWAQGDYRGIGSSAHSHRAGRRWWNVRTPDRYVRLIAAGESPVAAEEVLDPDRRAFERLALALRTSEGVPADAIEGVAELGEFVEVDSGRAVLTRAGRFVADDVALRLRVG